MVKGISRRVIVVDSPDPRVFDQAIFILRNDVLEGDGVSSRQLVDQAADPEVESAMAETIQAQDGVLRLDLLRTRQFGNRLYVDVEISADGNQSLSSAHDIADRVHDQIENDFPAVKHCMVHVNPISLP